MTDETRMDPAFAVEVKATTRPSAAVIRAWAAERGLDVGRRGRIPADVYQRYAEWELTRA